MVGVGWSLIRPILTMRVLMVVFGKLSKMPPCGAPYHLLVHCGILPWQFLSTALAGCGNSLLSNSNLNSKVYFPRIVVPVSNVISSNVDFLIFKGRTTNAESGSIAGDNSPSMKRRASFQ